MSRLGADIGKRRRTPALRWSAQSPLVGAAAALEENRAVVSGLVLLSLAAGFNDKLGAGLVVTSADSLTADVAVVAKAVEGGSFDSLPPRFKVWREGQEWVVYPTDLDWSDRAEAFAKIADRATVAVRSGARMIQTSDLPAESQRYLSEAFAKHVGQGVSPLALAPRARSLTVTVGLRVDLRLEADGRALLGFMDATPPRPAGVNEAESLDLSEESPPRQRSFRAMGEHVVGGIMPRESRLALGAKFRAWLADRLVAAKAGYTASQSALVAALLDVLGAAGGAGLTQVQGFGDLDPKLKSGVRQWFTMMRESNGFGSTDEADSYLARSKVTAHRHSPVLYFWVSSKGQAYSGTLTLDQLSGLQD